MYKFGGVVLDVPDMDKGSSDRAACRVLYERIGAAAASPLLLGDFSAAGEKNASMSSSPAESRRPVSLIINPVFLFVRLACAAEEGEGTVRSYQHR